MRYAILDNQRVDSSILTQLNNRYLCPSCHREVFLKKENGVYQFTHGDADDCDSFSHDMSTWHKNLQDCFEEEYHEVPISIQIKGEDLFKEAVSCGFYRYNKHFRHKDSTDVITITHRADVCINGYILEFQPDNISQEEFNEKNWFYTRAGYKLIWILNLSDLFEKERIFNVGYWENEETEDEGEHFLWKYAKRFMVNFIPQYRKDDIHLYIQLEDVNVFDEDDYWNNYIQKVVWAGKYNGGSNFKNFLTSVKIVNMTQLIEYIQETPNTVKPKKRIGFGFGFQYGENQIEKRRILNWMNTNAINWYAFVWYLAEYFTILDYTATSVTIKISSFKQREEFYRIVQQYQNDVAETYYNLGKTNFFYQTRHKGYQNNQEILQRLSVELD